MSMSAKRLAGALLLTVAAGWPATMADAAAPLPPSPTTFLFASSGVPARTAASSSRRRRRRAAPPGGVWSRHAVVLDPNTNEVLYAKNAATAVPIASLSKLMTALVLLEQNVDRSRLVEVTRTELYGAGRTQLRSRERVAIDDLLHMSLMCSDNVATRVLVRESGLSSEDFLARMNRKAVEIGLARTRFVEFTGLDERYVSTASDCARLLRAAAADPVIQPILTKRAHEFRSATRPHAVANTNRLLYGRYEILGGKTGFISEAGYCLATWVHTEQRDMIAVVLGAPTAATRFADVMRLVQRTLTPVTSTN